MWWAMRAGMQGRGMFHRIAGYSGCVCPERRFEESMPPMSCPCRTGFTVAHCRWQQCWQHLGVVIGAECDTLWLVLHCIAHNTAKCKLYLT